MKKKNFQYFIFDLDGVILNSLDNMNYSWSKTRKEFNIKAHFRDYKKFIGLPFETILYNLKVKNNYQQIKKFYGKTSKIKIKKIKLYSNVKKVLKIFKNKNLDYSIVTSKDINRTKKIIKFFNLYPKSIHCPKKSLRGKPYPDQILECLKKNKIKNKKKVCYVGDTNFDYLAAKKAGIGFIYCNYGYGKKSIKYKHKINNFKSLVSYIV